MSRPPGRQIRLLPSIALLPEAWRKLATDGPLHCFNPSLLADGEGWLLAYRVVGADNRRRLALCRLDAALEVVAGSALPLSDRLRPPLGRDYPDHARHWFADPRLYRIGGDLFLYWNSGWHEPMNHQFLQLLDNVTLAPRGPAREFLLAGERRPIEKNWTLFGEDGALAIYAPEPHQVLDLVEKQETAWLMRPRHAIDWDTGNFRQRYGILRGGAPLQLLGRHYYSFCHSVFGTALGYRYVASVYRFAAEAPFRPTDAPVRPLRLALAETVDLRRPSLNPATCSVIYPCGAAYRDGAWLISYGINDSVCAIAVLPAEEVEAALAPLPHAAHGAELQASGRSHASPL